MHSNIRIIICTLLIAAAVGMAALTLTGFSRRGVAEGYVLAAADGRVAVFTAGDRRTPVAVTDIELDTLRAADRALLDAGLAVPDGDALQRLLEDLGS